VIFTSEDDEYIISHKPNMLCKEIASAIGKTERQVIDRGQYLIKKGVNIQYIKRAVVDVIEHPAVKDGYDTVPWHMRIDGRDQAIPDLDYDYTGLTLGHRAWYNDSKIGG
jgi:hypothetical protein